MLATWLLAAAVNGSCSTTHPPRLEIATTTSVQNSGLLDALLPFYREQTGVDVRVHAAGSGRALQMMDEGLVDLVISHAPGAEARALASHPDWLRRELASNQFVLVGPPPDPARVRESADAVDAFRRIARSAAPFVSRGDLSGTHERETQLWEAAGERPPAARLIVSGRGMALALRHADELQGYTLSDEATFRQLEPELELEMVYQGDERLRNVYAVVHPRDDSGAAAFADWLVSGGGRDRIGAFAIRGRRMFTLPAVNH